jgi:hypothetical protein
MITTVMAAFAFGYCIGDLAFKMCSGIIQTTNHEHTKLATPLR